jgi:toluene monooxygenase system protein A
MAAVSPDERAWLVEKYPNWEQVYGDKWDVIIDNVNSNNMEATLPETLPWLCSTCHLPACNATQSRDGTWRVRDVQLTYDGRIYHFCTNACRQIFWKDRDNVNHETLIDRFLAGQIQPMDVGGILGYMGLTPDVMGDDPDYEAWTKDYAGRPASGLATPASAQS